MERKGLGLMLVIVFAAALAACGGGGESGSHSIKVTVSGLSMSGLVGEGLVLQCNGGDDLEASNGTFFFATKLAEGAQYNVTVNIQPTWHFCMVENGSGTYSRAGVPDVSVICSIGIEPFKPFSIILPLEPTANIMNSLSPVWPFGVHGGGHPEGHGGLDMMCDPACTVLAASSGIISEVKDDTFLKGGRKNITLIYNSSTRMGYDHMYADSEISVGMEVARGQSLGIANMVHFGLWHNNELVPVCPYDYLTPQAKAEFGPVFEKARYNEELTEHLVCNPLDAVFPMTRTWKLTSGALPAFIDFIRNSGDSYAAETYAFLNSNGSVTETGALRGFRYDLASGDVPWIWNLIFDSAAGSSQAAVANIVGGEMRIQWADTEKQVALTNASVYTMEPLSN